MEDYAQIIANLGFPIGVATYLLVRFEKKLDELARQTDDLEKTVKDLEDTVKNCMERVK